VKLVTARAPDAYAVAAHVEPDGKDPNRVLIVADRVPPGAAVGERVSFQVASIPGVAFQGHVDAIAPDRATLRAGMMNRDRRLQPGMPGEMRIDHAGVPGLELPRAAILPDGAVLVVAGSLPDGRVRFVERPVTIAFDGGARSVTVTGLEPATQIAAEASQVP
jgi:hypothetical protein